MTATDILFKPIVVVGLASIPLGCTKDIRDDNFDQDSRPPNASSAPDDDPDPGSTGSSATDDGDDEPATTGATTGSPGPETTTDSGGDAFTTGAPDSSGSGSDTDGITCPVECEDGETCVDGTCVAPTDLCSADPQYEDPECNACLAAQCCAPLEACYGDGTTTQYCAELDACLTSALDGFGTVVPECDGPLDVFGFQQCAEAACPETADQLGTLLQVGACTQANCAAFCS